MSTTGDTICGKCGNYTYGRNDHVCMTNKDAIDQPEKGHSIFGCKLVVDNHFDSEFMKHALS